MLIIQCKNWKNAPKQKDLKVFAMDCETFKEKFKDKYKNKNMKFIFATSCQEVDNGISYFLNEYNAKHEIKIDYQVIEMKECDF